MAITIKTSYVVVDFRTESKDYAKELDEKLNDGWYVVETYQLEFGLIYEMRRVTKILIGDKNQEQN